MLTMIINLISWLSLFRFYDFQVKDDRLSIFTPHTHTQIKHHPCNLIGPKHFYASQNTNKNRIKVVSNEFQKRTTPLTEVDSLHMLSSYDRINLYVS